MVAFYLGMVLGVFIGFLIMVLLTAVARKTKSVELSELQEKPGERVLWVPDRAS